MAEADVWVPIYIGDYLADTREFTTEQHGAYFLLILAYWRKGPLPDDDGKLSRVTGLSLRRWRSVRPVLAEVFDLESAPGRWTHKRIDSEIQRSKEAYQRRLTRSRKAAEMRWSAQAQVSEGNEITDASKHATSIAPGVLIECPSPSPSPSPKDKERVDLPSVPIQASPLPDPPPPALAEILAEAERRDGIAAPPPETEPATPTRAGALCRRLRALSVTATPAQFQLPKFKPLLERYTDDQIVAAAEIAHERKPGESVGLSYLIPVLEDSAKPRPDKPAGLGDWWSSDAATIKAAGTLGIQAKRGESFGDLRNRIKETISHRKGGAS